MAFNHDTAARPVVKRPDSMTPKPQAATTMQMGPVIHRAGLQPKTVKTVRTLEATQSSPRGRTPTAQKGPAPLSWSLRMKATSEPPGSLQCAPSLNQTTPSAQRFSAMATAPASATRIKGVAFRPLNRVPVTNSTFKAAPSKAPKPAFPQTGRNLCHQIPRPRS